MSQTEEVVKFFRETIDWNKFFGVCLDIKEDPGFSSRADNFTVSTAIEKALVRFCDSKIQELKRIDAIGCDLMHKIHKGVEVKAASNLFRVQNIRSTSKHLMERNILGKDDTYPVKIKSFQGKKKPEEFLEFYRNTSTCNYYLIIQTAKKFDAAIVEDEYVRSRLYSFSDGLLADFEKDKIHRLNLQNVNPIRQSEVKLSDLYLKAESEFFKVYDNI